MSLKNSLLIIFLCLCSISFSQTDFKDVYKESKSCYNHFRLKVPIWCFRWCIFEDELHAAFSGVKKVSLIVMEKSNDDFLQALSEFNSNANYEDVVIVKDDSLSFQVKANFEKDLIREVVILVQERKETVYLSMKGRIEKKDLQSLIEIAQKQL